MAELENSVLPARKRLRLASMMFAWAWTTHLALFLFMTDLPEDGSWLLSAIVAWLWPLAGSIVGSLVVYNFGDRQPLPAVVLFSHATAVAATTAALFMLFGDPVLGPTPLGLLPGLDALYAKPTFLASWWISMFGLPLLVNIWIHRSRR